MKRAAIENEASYKKHFRNILKKCEKNEKTISGIA